MPDPTLSVVIPCLNEADTIGGCVRSAKLSVAGYPGTAEVVVADNGSSDDSVVIAETLGARVIAVSERGYGAALMGGIAAAKGEWIIMADADASYDFAESPRFVEQLRAGFDLVMGCRLPKGGGRVLPGAMPFLHERLGNPIFSAMARRWFHAPVNDVHCGMRAFTRDLFERLDLRCTGMEFASEMVIRAALAGARIGEVPITLRPDERHNHPPHLRTFRDGWRHLRFYLLFSPRWLFGLPGILLLTLGVIAGVVAFPGLTIGRVGFDVHTLLFAGFFVLLGLQMLLFGILAKSYGVAQGLLPPSRMLTRAERWLRLEVGIVLGLAFCGAGACLLAIALLQWIAVDFGELDYSRTMRVAIPGVILVAMGCQIIFAGFLLGLYALPQRIRVPEWPSSRGGVKAAGIKENA